MTSGRTRPGPIREGIEYQDCVALHFLVDMLENRNEYDWIQVEASEAGSLDDVVLKRRNGGVVLCQVKYATDPHQDPWTWNSLLQREKGKKGPKKSLLMRWADSYFTWRKRGGKAQDEAWLVSNRPLGEELAPLVTRGKLDVDALPNGPIGQAVVEQVGGEDRARAFFQVFRFQSEQEYDLEQTHQRFLGLGGTESGWASLQRAVRTWACHRDQPRTGGRIRLAHVEAAAEWHRPESLPQEFRVPDDYVLPESFYTGVITRLDSMRSGGLLIQAPPGFGKSTLLSRLYADLHRAGRPVIRHHYFLSTGDRGGERLSHVRAAESLMSQIQRAWPGVLSEEKARRNPTHREFGRWLDDVGPYFQKRRKTLVVIVDGLDHVKKDLDSVAELTALFQYLVPPRKGIVFLFGTQPVSDEWLTPALNELVTPDRRLDLPPMDHTAIARWLDHHRPALCRPDGVEEGAWAADLAAAFAEKSGGHPLVLRYMLQALTATGLPVTAADVRALPGTPHPDLNVYYASLWRSLPENAREVLHLLAACRWEWPGAGIIACLDPQGYRPTVVSEGLRLVSHLLMGDAAGLRAVHRSLLLFVEGLAEHALQAQRLRQLAVQWLESQAPPYLRWKHVWRLQTDLGLPASAPDLPWLLDALVQGYPRHEAREALAESARRALQARDLGRWTAVAALAVCVEHMDEELEGDWVSFLGATLAAPGGTGFLQDPSRWPSLTAPELVDLAWHAFRRGEAAQVEAIVAELSARGDGDFDSQPYPLETAEAAALLPDPVGWLLGRIAAFIAGRDWPDEVLVRFCQSLCRARRPQEARRVLEHAAHRLGAGQRALLQHYLVPHLLEAGMSLPPGLQVLSPRAAACLALTDRGDHVGDVLYVPGARVLVDRVTRLSPFPEKLQAVWFLVANLLLDRPERIAEWAGQYEEAIRPMQQLAGRLAAVLRSQEPVPLLAGITAVTGRDRGLKGLHLEVLAARLLTGVIPAVSRAELEEAFPAGEGLSGWVMACLEYGRPWLEEDALAWVLTAAAPRSSDGQAVMSLRDLAALATLHGRQPEAAGLTRRAAATFVLAVLGQRFFSAAFLETLARMAGRPEAPGWLQAACMVVPLSSDQSPWLGRQTETLIAAVLAVAPGLLPGLCQAARQVPGLPGTVMQALVTHMDLEEPICGLLATTADWAAAKVLARLAQAGKPGAREALTFSWNPAERLLEAEEEEDGSWFDSLLPEKRSLRNPEAYAPSADGLCRLLTAEAAQEGWTAPDLRSWFTYWHEQGEGPAVLQALTETGAWEKDGLYDLLFEQAVRQGGAEEARPWLVRWLSYLWLGSVFDQSPDMSPHFARYYWDSAVDVVAEALLTDRMRLIEYPVVAVMAQLASLRRWEGALAIGNAAVRTTIEAHALAGTPVPGWLQEPPEPDWGIGLLALRLTDPDGQVAGRALESLAQLLVDPETRPRVVACLARWTAGGAAESIACLPWLVGLRALELEPGLDPTALEGLVSLCGTPSLLSQAIAPRLGMAFAAGAGAHPAGFAVPAPDEVGREYHATVLNLEAVQEVRRHLPEGEAGGRILRQWYSEWRRLGALRPLSGEHRERSAYLRALARAEAEGWLDARLARQMAVLALPQGLRHVVEEAILPLPDRRRSR